MWGNAGDLPNAEPGRAAPFDEAIHRRRNLIERAFCKLNDWRGIATRYDKTARNFLALAVVINHWLP